MGTSLLGPGYMISRGWSLYRGLIGVLRGIYTDWRREFIKMRTHIVKFALETCLQQGGRIVFHLSAFGLITPTSPLTTQPQLPLPALLRHNFTHHLPTKGQYLTALIFTDRSRLPCGFTRFIFPPQCSYNPCHETADAVWNHSVHSSPLAPPKHSSPPSPKTRKYTPQPPQSLSALPYSTTQSTPP